MTEREPLQEAPPETVGLVDATARRDASRQAALARAVLAGTAGAILMLRTPAPLAAFEPHPAAVVADAAAAPSPAQTTRSTPTNVSGQAAAGPSDRDLETAAIEDVMRRYRDAFNRLDAGAVSAVWPTVDEKALASAFERLTYQNVSFSGCEIAPGVISAVATCIGSARYEPRIGNRATTPQTRRWRFSFRKSGGAWLIDSVDMR